MQTLFYPFYSCAFLTVATQSVPPTLVNGTRSVPTTVTVLVVVRGFQVPDIGNFIEFLGFYQQKSVDICYAYTVE